MLCGTGAIAGAPATDGALDDADVFGVDPGVEIAIVDALALGSSCALAKSEPPRIATPAANATMKGNFFFALRGVEL